MVFVKLRNNIRWFESDDTEFNISVGVVKELPEKLMRSYTLKDMLFCGQLLVMEGEVLFSLKNGKIFISGSNPGVLYGYEYEKYFIKDLIKETITWLEEDKVPTSIKEKIQGNLPLETKAKECVAVNYGIESLEDVKPVEIKPIEDNPLDLNKDGVVDKKDISLAGKVLGSKKRKKK